MKKKKKRPIKPKEPLALATILQWADEHYERTGDWPNCASGPIAGVFREKWSGVDKALSQGTRGLHPGGRSLAKLLAEFRGHRNRLGLPPVTEEQILQWCDEHFQRHGIWPGAKSGLVQGVKNENWRNVEYSLIAGRRGLTGGSCLTRLLYERRGVRRWSTAPTLTEEQILAWASAQFEREGRWPGTKDGSIAEVPGETWTAVDAALRDGLRGLPGGSSLPSLLSASFSVRFRRGRTRTRHCPPALTEDQILAWADDQFRQHGKWPVEDSGTVDDAPDENWSAISNALRMGLRGLPGGDSLPKLLQRRRSARNHLGLPRLSETQLLAWADHHFEQTGAWPAASSGTVLAEPSESWRAIHAALQAGARGMQGGTTLARLLAQHRGVRNRKALPPISEEQVLQWILAYRQRTGEWPTDRAGMVEECPGQTWCGVAVALKNGTRGLPGGSSLVKLRARAISCAAST